GAVPAIACPCHAAVRNVIRQGSPPLLGETSGGKPLLKDSPGTAGVSTPPGGSRGSGAFDPAPTALREARHRRARPARCSPAATRWNPPGVRGGIQGVGTRADGTPRRTARAVG